MPRSGVPAMVKLTSPRTAFLPERRDRYERPGTVLADRQAREAQRRNELDQVRLQRRLTSDELAEHDRLIGRLYMREWRRANDSAGAAS